MYYTIYKTINLINQKTYVGFHTIKSLEDILAYRSETGSIFEDGYLGSGKLLGKALEKYGPLNMCQELLLVTEDRKEAENLERFIVNKDWVDSEDTYNLSIGGGITILYGENNGFYGKNHTEETLQKIQEGRKKAYNKQPFSWSKSYLVENPDIKFYNKEEIKEFFNLNDEDHLWISINKLVYEGIIKYSSSYLQDAVLRRYENHLNYINSHNERLEKKRKLVSERFKGKPKSKESNEKRGKSISNWIKDNPELHTERMNKINKNPEKINKMVKKQTGKIWIRNPETGKNTRIDPDLGIPDGWIRGFKKSK